MRIDGQDELFHLFKEVMENINFCPVKESSQ